MSRPPSNPPASGPDDAPAGPITLTAREPGDIVALIPRVLGFRPDHSLVMVSIGGRGLHARVDLPDRGSTSRPPGRAWDAAVDALLEPAVRHRLPSVVLVLYTDDAEWADGVRAALRQRFEDAGVPVRELLRVHDGAWFPLMAPTPAARRRGTGCNDRTHPWILDALVDGEVIHESREALQHSLDLDQPAADQVLDALLDQLGERATRLDHGEPVAEIFSGLPERAWLSEFVRTHAVLPTPTMRCGDVARLLIDCLDVGVRDVVWAQLDRGNARAHQQFWVAIVRQAIDFWGSTPAAYLGLASWLAGDGATAWCAVDRCLIDEPDHALAQCVAHLLEGAFPPDTWEQLRREVA